MLTVITQDWDFTFRTSYQDISSHRAAWTLHTLIQRVECVGKLFYSPTSPHNYRFSFRFVSQCWDFHDAKGTCRIITTETKKPPNSCDCTQDGQCISLANGLQLRHLAPICGTELRWRLSTYKSHRQVTSIEFCNFANFTQLRQQKRPLTMVFENDSATKPLKSSSTGFEGLILWQYRKFLAGFLLSSAIP